MAKRIKMQRKFIKEIEKQEGSVDIPYVKTRQQTKWLANGSLRICWDVDKCKSSSVKLLKS